MFEYFNQQKSSIQEYLTDYLGKKSNQLAPVNPWGKDGCRLLQEFSVEGKMIRGGLLMLSHALFDGFETSEALKAAAAIELLQAALLIHDDIMDRDLTRRGKPSVFYQYRNLGTSLGLNHDHAYHFGESMGICLGDLAFFLAHELLTSIQSSPAIVTQLVSVFSRELQLVTLGQMQDVYLGTVRRPATIEEILNIYRYKTARYTFFLPLISGAILAGQSAATLETLAKLGEDLGIIFQIKDDELGLFGTEATIGKPVGSDIKEGKRTLFLHYLFEQTDSQTRHWLQEIIAQGEIQPVDLEKIQQILIQKEIRTQIDNLVNDLAKSVRDRLRTIPFSNQAYQSVFDHFVEYNLTREK